MPPPNLRVSYTIGICRVPPTYFAIQHAERMDNIDATLFGLVLEKGDPSVKTPFVSAVPSFGNRLSFNARQKIEPLFLRRMSRQIAAFGPDLIHQHFGTWTYPAVWAARRTGRPLIVTLHGVDVFNRLKKPTTAMLRWHHRNLDVAAKEATRFHPVSKYLADKAMTAGVPASKLHVHYQGVDSDFFTPDDTAKPEREQPTMLYVGALNEAKGIRDAIEASIRAYERYPHSFRIVGNGPLLAEVTRATQEHSHISYVGSLDRRGVREELRSADFFVMTTKKHQGWEEAAGLVTLEAEATGLPVVVNRSGGTPEMFIEGETGLGVDRGNVDDLTDKITAMLSMGHDERVDMGQRGRDFVVRERSLISSCDALMDSYMSLV